MTPEEDCCRGSRKGSPETCASECIWARAAISGTPPVMGLSRAEREKQDDEAEISRLARRVEALTVRFASVVAVLDEVQCQSPSAKLPAETPDDAWFGCRAEMPLHPEDWCVVCRVRAALRD